MSSFFSAGLSIIQFLVDPDHLGSIVLWLMGGFIMASWDLVGAVPPLMLPRTGLLLALSFRLNILSLGEEEAQSLGLPARRYRMALIAIASLLTAAAVSVWGITGWVGLMVPHMARTRGGSGTSQTLALCGFVGRYLPVVGGQSCPWLQR